MTKALNAIKRFVADEEGVALVEYTILIGILVLAGVTIISTIFPIVHYRWWQLCNSVTQGGNCP